MALELLLYKGLLMRLKARHTHAFDVCRNQVISIIVLGVAVNSRDWNVGMLTNITQ